MSTINAYGQTVGDPLPGWTARPRPGQEAMVGRFCRVETFVAALHAQAFTGVFAAAADDRDWTYLPDDRPAGPADYPAFCAALEASRDPLHHAIIGGTSGRVVGSAAFLRIDPANGVIEVGAIRYAPQLQRTPAGTEAMYLMMRRAFDELGYRRYEWKCDAFNAPSRRAAERYGFRFEGIFRQAVVVKGRSRDTAWYSIIDGEWPAVRAAFEAWLSADNFDQAGRQIRRLAASAGRD